MKLTYEVNTLGDPDAGIGSVLDTIVVEVESGDAGGERGEFAEFIRGALCDWYDSGRIHLERVEP